MQKAREEKRVANEEDGCVVSGQIPVTLLGVELDGKSWLRHEPLNTYIQRSVTVFFNAIE